IGVLHPRVRGVDEARAEVVKPGRYLRPHAKRSVGLLHLVILNACAKLDVAARALYYALQDRFGEVEFACHQVAGADGVDPGILARDLLEAPGRRAHGGASLFARLIDKRPGGRPLKDIAATVERALELLL